MFYHGINREHVFEGYPILSPRKGVSHKSREQLQDRRHLLLEFGLEPIHLLEESDNYPFAHCLQECFSFGDTVFVFTQLPDPLWQLSCHEVGVSVLDLRSCRHIYALGDDEKLRQLFPKTSLKITNIQ